MNRLGKILDTFDQALERYFAKKWHWAITAPAVLLLVLGGYFLFCFTTVPYVQNGYRDEASRIAARVIAGALITLSLCYVFVEAGLSRLTARKTVWAFLLIASVFMSLWGYANSLNLYAHHHDAGSYGSGNHWSIIYDIYTTHQIPAVNLRNQYYQPKFFHALIAGLMMFNGLFLRLGDGPSTGDAAAAERYSAYTISAYHSLELTRVFMILLGIVSFYAIYRIYTGLGLKGKKLGIVTALTVMIPEFWYTQCFLNNDGLALTLSLVALALALEFHRSEKLLPLLFSAATLGLAMMAKLNAGLVAIPMAAVFLYDFVAKCKTKEKTQILTLLGKFALFAVIVFPLGLWTPLLYKVKYDMPIGYVLDLTPTEASKQAYFMYIDPTYYNFFQRCIAFPSRDLFFSPFNLRARPWGGSGYLNEWGTIDYNCWTAFFKTGIFDEWGDFHAHYGYFVTALLIGGLYLEVFLVLVAVFMTLYYVFRFFRQKRYQNGFLKELVLLTILVTYVANYVIFVNRYPVGCSQNARYVMPLFLVIQTLVGSTLADGHDALIRLADKAREQEESV